MNMLQFLMVFLVLLPPLLILYCFSTIVGGKPAPRATYRYTQQLQARLSGEIRNMNEVATFTQIVAQIQAAHSMSSREKAIGIAKQYQESRRRLRDAGQLTAQVDRELESLVRLTLTALLAQTGEMGQSLNFLLDKYEPRRIRGPRLDMAPSVLGNYFRELER